MGSILIWIGFGLVMAGPLIAAGFSPLLAWRDPVYIASGFAGIVAMGLLMLQPLLLRGVLPGLPLPVGRVIHKKLGLLLVSMVLVHVIGLWMTSPPDVVDALLFVSPTPFSAWGVVAMWAIFATTGLALFWRRWHVRPVVWRTTHLGLGFFIAVGTVIHAVLIEGTMETITKIVLCIALICSVGGAVFFRKPR